MSKGLVNMQSLIPCRQRLLLLTSSVRFASTATVSDSREPNLDVKPFSAIPGPKPLPVLRNLLELKRNMTKFHLYFDECHKKYGEIFKLEAPGGNNFVMMTDLNQLENILRAEGKYPRRDNNLSPNMEWLLTRSNYPVQFALKHGEEWKEGRSAASNQIRPRNVFSYTAGLNDVGTRFTDYIRSARDENDRISDISLPLKRLLMEMSAKFVFNTDLHALDEPTEVTEQFIEAVQLFFECIGKLIVEPPLYKFYPNKLYRDFNKSLKTTREYGMKHAENVRQKIESGEEESEVQGLLEQWLREGKMNVEEALSLSSGMFFAGVDTTSNQAAFLLYLMAKNPEAQEELYRQIQSVLGDCTLPTAEDLSKIPHLKGCMMESFRMHPTALGNVRLLQEETTIMGYHIPAQTNVWYLNFLAGKNEQLFLNPEKFDPARWARDKPHPFAVLPFGFGPRSCYGRRFAELELKLLLCQITQSFVLGTDLENLDKEVSAVVKPAGDLPIYFKVRSN